MGELRKVKQFGYLTTSANFSRCDDANPTAET
jgi:hypothetical protein